MTVQEIQNLFKRLDEFDEATKYHNEDYKIWKLESDIEYIILYGKKILRNQIDFETWLEMQRASSDELIIFNYGDEETPIITEDFSFAEYELVN